ncbi:MAG: alanine dehydrogenase [Tessaracoccus sp.]|uniref:alanine dehydrogenase n=1 Tax=Tessaracoccus sp. TaxID=1971211 RepID=UPI001EC9B344|nr:alanine dehydrogenase [Tessaracoccus sp.]MBK7822371.1 alanine dehydrogenase [Tessaracoccus sp.]
MLIGVPREVKNSEFRVALTPVGAHELVARGHRVAVETGAGVGSAIADDDYRAVGAVIVEDPDLLWADADLVLKVKEPLPEEYHRLRPGLTLFTYLHLAANERLTDALLASGVTAVAYETVQLPSGMLPLLYPMSEVAGCLAPQLGAQALLKNNGGRGVLMGGIAGVANAKVVVLGAGTAGQNATHIAVGMGADVTLLDTNFDKLRDCLRIWDNRVHQLASSELVIRQALRDADLVIGTVLAPGARAPKLVTDDMVATMKPGSVLVDVSIDQGGCFEPSRPTTHADPTFPVHGSTFYCVANIPGAVPVTSTWALTNATLPYVRALADHGWQGAMRADAAVARGLSAHAGLLTSEPVAAAFGREWTPVEAAIEA